MDHRPHATRLLTAVLAATVLPCAHAHAAPSEDDFLALGGPASPAVAFALKKEPRRLRLWVRAETLAPDARPAVRLGLAAGHKLVLDAKDADVSSADGQVTFAFAVEADDLADRADDWNRLRMALAVRWPGGPAGTDRRRERFRHLDGRAPHAGLSTDPRDWAPLDIRDVATLVADRKSRIRLTLRQPIEGKATVAIEDLEGRRVRNLLAGESLPAGKHRVEWNALDDAGRLVAPGRYRWRSVHHPGIRPVYRMSYANGGETTLRPWGTNHGVFTDATTNGRKVFFAAPLTEGGHALVALDFDGNLLAGYRQIHGTGIHAVAAAADEEFFYAAHDGPAWGQRVDRKKPGWRADVRITLTRFEIDSGKTVDFPGGKRFAVLEPYAWGPGSDNPGTREQLSLTGMALVGGRLYLASRASQALLVIDPATGKITGRLSLPKPGPVTAGDGFLLASSGGKIVRVKLPGGGRKPVVDVPGLDPAGIATGPDGRIYVSDAATHTVKVFDAAGKAVRTLGIPGGAHAGAYVPERLVHPLGLVFAGGRLWTTESRRNPKRIAAWDLESGKVVYQKYGCPPYGGPGASFDPEDASRWLGLGCQWRLDLGAGSASCTHVLNERWQLRPRYRFVRADGRTFLLGFGKVIYVSEILPDGTLKDHAFLASTHRYCYHHHWDPPAAFVEAFRGAYPPPEKGRALEPSDKGPGVLWVDANGDGELQPGEMDFSTDCEHFAGGSWGHDQYDLTLRVPITMDGQRRIAVLAPDGFLPGGAPKYPGLNAACKAGVAIALARNEVDSAVDRFGNMVCNAEPAMKCFSPAGELLWTYPNRWVGVHGSHKAPLPRTGVLQGALFFLGMARLDDKADVFVLNGNHGRFFVMTSDGMYLDEMFKDVRVGGARDEYYIGGEPFGGSFGRAEADGTYYLQTGGDGYRVYRVEGLDEVRRAEGELTVTPEQILAADRRIARRRTAESPAPAEATIAFRDEPPRIDGRDNDWPRAATASWDPAGGRRPVTVRASHDGENLYLCYVVADASPWVNGGKDWTTLFKTGDSVDLQLGTDPAARPGRKRHARGDIRLLIAPFEGKPLAVLYHHRAPDDANAVTFASPWRSEKVNVVRKLPAARVAVEVSGGRYCVEAAVPLKALGLADPAAAVLPGDFGVIYGDRDGTINTLRSYWANKATMLVSDVPGEIMLHPDRWGVLRFSARGGE